MGGCCWHDGNGGANANAHTHTNGWVITLNSGGVYLPTNMHNSAILNYLSHINGGCESGAMLYLCRTWQRPV